MKKGINITELDEVNLNRLPDYTILAVDSHEAPGTLHRYKSVNLYKLILELKRQVVLELADDIVKERILEKASKLGW